MPEPDKKIVQTENQQHIEIKIPPRLKPDEEHKQTDPTEPPQMTKQVIDVPVVSEAIPKEVAPPKHRGRPPKNNKLKTEVQTL